MSDSDEESSEDLSSLAIIGYSFNFPGTGSCPIAFWSMMMARECAVSEFPCRAVRAGEQSNPDRNQQDNNVSETGEHPSKKDERRFDTSFFKKCADEAEEIDLQEGLVLEAVYHALENAGLLMRLIANTRTSVFVGSSSVYDKSPGMGRCTSANRVSKFFKFHGPSATVDTGGSSGLAAVELACQTIWCGDADMGIAVGCNLILTPDSTAVLDKHGMLSPEGRCYSFDARANGIELGEGIGVLVIKPLKEAIRQKDMVRAVIRSAASGYDGAAPRFGQPSLESQRRLVKDTYEKAGLEMWKTDYFEANGQGTPESDAVEAKMISSVFRRHRQRNDPLCVGSVKSNLGHLEGASGIAAVIKVILCFEKGVIPGNSINYQNPNKDIDPKSLNIKILDEAVPWPQMSLRRTSVHSFGFGGSCTHLILEDPFCTTIASQLDGGLQRPVRPSPAIGSSDTSEAASRRLDNLIFPFKSELRKQEQRAKAKLLVLSTHDKDGVPRLQEAWSSYFTHGTIENVEKQNFLRDLSYTLGWRRNHLQWRTFVVANSTQNLVDLPGKLAPSTRVLRSPKIAFIFTGEGYAWDRMGWELVNRYPIVKLTLAKVNKYLKKWNCQWDILDELQKTGQKSHVHDPKYTLPMCTALQIALVDLLETWNITPAVVVGHGSGEIAAAYCSRALDLPGAMKIAVSQGRMIKKYPLVMVSAMLSVDLPEEKLHPYTTQLSVYYTNFKVNVAYINTKNSVVLSGPLNQLNALKAMLDDDKIDSTIRTTDIPYHSRGMGDGDVVKFRTKISKWLRMQPSHDDDDAPPMISTVKGRWVKPETLIDDHYWVENFADAVQFYKAMVQVCSPVTIKRDAWSKCPHLPEVSHILEIGPHPSLQEYVEGILRETGKEDSITYLSTMTQDVSAIETTLNAAGRLFTSGYPVDLGMVNSDISDSQPSLYCDLPGYPFNHGKPESQNDKVAMKLSQKTVTNPQPEVPTSKESLCHRLEWKPDVDLLRTDDLRSLFASQQAQSEERAQFCMDLNFLIAHYILKAVQYLKTVGPTGSKEHVKRYRNWMVEQKGRLKAGDFGFTLSDCKSILADNQSIEDLHKSLESTNKEGLFYSTICRSVLKVLKQEIQPEDLVQNRLVAGYYFEMFTRRPWMERFGIYLELLTHKKPDIKILQIGAGNGPISLAVAKAMTDEKNGYAGFKYSHWDYTDASETTLEDAKNKLGTQQNRMSFNTLNIEEDLGKQGFELGSYDVAIVATAHHTITNLKLALENIRMLLKLGGKLILLGPVRPGGIRTTFAFGLLESWWIGQGRCRKSGCCVDVNEWDEQLQKAGFSGADLVFPDYDEPVYNELSIICSTAPEKSANASEFLVNIQHIASDPTQLNLTRALDKKLKESGQFGVRHELIPKGKPPYPVKSRLQICLFELNNAGIFDMSKKAFDYLKRLLKAQTNILWVSGGGGTNPDPRYRIVEGLFRSLCQEDSRMKITSLFLDLTVLESERAADQIIKIVHLFSQKAIGALESEYAEQNGLLHIGRLMEASDLNHNLYVQGLEQQTRILPFASGPRLKIGTVSYGPVRTLQFVEDISSNDLLGPTEIEIEIQAVGVNSPDLLVTSGVIPDDSPGHEFSGIVTRVGAVCRRFNEGDHVVGCFGGCYRSHIRLDESMVVVKFPPSLSFCEAAAIPVNFATAWIALHTARVKAGETVLINCECDGTRQAVIQIALLLGATVFTTVRLESEKRVLIDLYNIPTEHIFFEANQDLTKIIKCHTESRGVDVILNSQPGEDTDAPWECIAPYGRILEISEYGAITNYQVPMRALHRNVTLACINIPVTIKDGPAVVISAIEEVLNLMDKGFLHLPYPYQIHAASDINTAFEEMEGERLKGKSVIRIGADDLVLATLNTKPNSYFDPNASYVIAGGLGGLGRVIVRWFVERGARNLILLGRSGAENVYAEQVAVESSVRAAHVVTPSCDISDERALADVLNFFSETMPPIKGCIHAAMVLQDSTFENMTYKAWRAATAPKTHGSWNLHKLLPKGMDFFVMLSAVTALTGARGQSNYAAGNTFQDGLARYRVGMGERAVALDLGYFSSAGIILDSVEVRDRVTQRMEFEPIEEWELLAVLDQFCHAGADSLLVSNPQVSVGIQRHIRERGFDIMDWKTRPMFNHLAIPGLDDPPIKPNFAKLIGEVVTLGDAQDNLVAELRCKISKFLGVPAAGLHPGVPLAKYGVDSHLLVYLRAWIVNDVRADIEKYQLEGDASIKSIADWVVENSEYAKTEWEYFQYERYLISLARKRLLEGNVYYT